MIGFDTETFLIKPGMLAPRPVCLSYYYGEHDRKGLVLRDTGIELMHEWLDNDEFLIAHNAPFDFAVLCEEDLTLIPKVFEALRKGNICDTITRQKLLDIALGMRKFRRVGGVVTKTTYSLADLVKLYFNEHLEKNDTWRLRYNELDGIPTEEWPEDAATYAIDDAVWAYRVYEAQAREMVDEFGGPIPNELEQQRAAWALHLMSMWGIRAEKSRVDYFIEHCEEEITKMHVALKDTGIFKADGSRTMSVIRDRVVAACEQRKVQVPRTDPSTRFPDGQVCTDAETLKDTEDPELIILAESMVYAKHLSQWGPILKAAVDRPVCSRYNVLVETGRTSCSGSEGQEGGNLQNPPRNSDVRPAIISRPGYVFCTTDADTIELRAHAQDILDFGLDSEMARYLIAQHKEKGPDLHEVLAANIVGIDVKELRDGLVSGDEYMIDARQFSKIPNFGFLGGLGAESFVAYAAGQLDREQFIKWFSANRGEAIAKAQEIRDVWFETFPENREYFRIVGQMIDREKGYGTIRQLQSNRIRGEVRFTAAANGFFQGRVADAMKEILWRLAQECYTGRESNKALGYTGKRSILYGCRPAMFLHDEPILELIYDKYVTERAERQRTIVVESLSNWMPDIPCTSSAALMLRWQKGAKPLLVDGNLVPVKPIVEKTSVGKKKTVWVQDVAT